MLLETKVTSDLRLVTGDVRRPARGRLLGEVMHGPAGSELRVTVSSHSTDGWRQFLRKYASSSSEAPKLVMFMALAIGRRHLNVDDGSSLSLRGMSPVTEMEALALMEAFLSVGPGINLADSTLERPGGTGGAVVVHTGPIMAAFNGRFAATALERMTRREKRFGPRQVANVTAYAGDASGMKDHADDNLGGQTQDPVQSLIASSFGAAASAAAGWIRYEEKDDRRESRHCAKLLFNSAVVINGCLAQIEADAAARKALFMTIFKGAVGATAGALVGPLAGAVFGAFAPAAEQLFEFCMSGDSTKQRAETMHAFHLAIDELSDNWGLKAAQGTKVTGVFQDGLS